MSSCTVWNQAVEAEASDLNPVSLTTIPREESIFFLYNYILFFVDIAAKLGANYR